MTREEAMDKIRKLLALSKSTNQHEAQLALSNAHKMMAKYDIVEIEAESVEIEHITQECTGGRSKKWVQILTSIISTNFRCKAYYNGNHSCFYGRTEDVMAAKMAYEYAYKFITRESGKRYREAVEWHGTGAGVVNSYAFGFLNGLKEVLEAQSVALMVVTPQDVLDGYAKRREELGLVKVKLRNGYCRRDKNYEEGYHDGRTSQTRRIE